VGEGGARRAPDLAKELAGRKIVDRREDVLLAFEVSIERAPRDPCGGQDVLDTRGGEPEPREDRDRRRDDRALGDARGEREGHAYMMYRASGVMQRHIAHACA